MTVLAAAVRPTRRDAIRHPWRILVAILLIALPVGVISYQWVWTDSTQLSARVPGAPTTIGIDYAACLEPEGFGGPSPDPVDCPTGAELDRVLPEGFESHFFVDHMYASVSGRNFTDDMEVVQLPLEAVPEGFSPSAGHVPGPGEVMVPGRLQRVHGVAVGDQVTLLAGPEAADLTVSGFTPGNTALVTGTTLLSPTEQDSGAFGAMRWQVSGPRELTEEDARRFEGAGFTVQSEDLPGRRSPTRSAQDGMSTGQRISFGVGRAATILIGLLILVLVMSPVFTIAAARQTRNYALMRAQGATPRHIQWAVLAYGAIAGGLSATAGVGLGTVTAAIAWQLSFAGWPFTIAWGALLMLWLSTIGVAVISAALPARRAERSGAADGMSGANTDRITGWRRSMAVGPVLLVLVTLGWFGARVVARVLFGNDDRILYFPFFNPAYPLLVLVVVVALAASVPALLLAVARLIDRAGLVWRMAGRDARRRALSSTASMAAIVTVVFIVSTTLVTIRSMEERTLAEAVSTHPANLATVQYMQTNPYPTGDEGGATEAELALAMTALGSTMTTSSNVPLEQVVFENEPDPAVDGSPVGYGVYFQDQARCREAYVGPMGEDPRIFLEDPELATTCLSYLRSSTAHSPLAQIGSMLLATDEVLGLFTWADAGSRSRAAASLDQPTLIVSKEHERLGSPRQLSVARFSGDGYYGPEEEAMFRTDVPVLPVLPEGYNGPMLITPSLVSQLGLETRFAGFATMTADVPDFAERQRAQQAVGVLNPHYSVIFNTQFLAPRSMYWQVAGMLGLGIFTIISLVAALGVVGDRRRYDRMAAFGAAPGTAQQIAAVSAWLLAFVGSGAGLLAGHLAALSRARTAVYNIHGDVILRGDLAYLGVEWAEVVVLLVITPLLAGIFAAAIHLRSGNPEGVAQRED